MRPPVLDVEKFAEDEAKLKAKLKAAADERQSHTFLGKTKRLLGSVRSIGASTLRAVSRRHSGTTGTSRKTSRASVNTNGMTGSAPSMRLSVVSDSVRGGSGTGGAIGRTDAGPIALEDLKSAHGELSSTADAIAAVPRKPKRGTPKIDVSYKQRTPTAKVGVWFGATCGVAVARRYWGRLVAWRTFGGCGRLSSLCDWRVCTAGWGGGVGLLLLWMRYHGVLCLVRWLLGG